MDLKEYKVLYNNKEEKLYKLWIVVFVLIISFILFMFNSIDYEKFYKNNAIVVEKNKIKFYCNNEDLINITKNKKIIIEGKNFAYRNLTISNVIYNEKYYNEIVMDVDLSNNINVINNIIDFKILLQKKTILQYIFYKIGGIKWRK